MCPEDLTAGANIDDASPLPATRGLSVAVPRVLGMALVAGILSLVAALVSLRLTSESLRLPLGRDDAVAFYQLTNTMVRSAGSHGTLTSATPTAWTQHTPLAQRSTNG